MIRISLLERKKVIEISIIDNGKGIKEEHLPKIFESFFTTKKIGKGTSLGLSIIRGIIERNKRDITISSTSGEGTEAIVTLPRMID